MFCCVYTIFCLNYQRGIYVAGLREEIVASPEQVLELMEFGECNVNFAVIVKIFFYHSKYSILTFFPWCSAHRHIGETNMNLYSSRSHTIFRMVSGVFSLICLFSLGKGLIHSSIVISMIE